MTSDVHLSQSLARGDGCNSSEPALHHNHHHCLSRHLFSVEIPISETYPRYCRYSKVWFSWKNKCEALRSECRRTFYWLWCENSALITEYFYLMSVPALMLPTVASRGQKCAPVIRRSSPSEQRFKNYFQMERRVWCLEKRCTLTLHVKTHSWSARPPTPTS